MFILWKESKSEVFSSGISKSIISNYIKLALSSDWSLLFLIALFFEASSAASALTNKYNDYFQISENLHTSLSGLAIIWILIRLIATNRPISKLRVSAIVLLCIQLSYGFISTVFIYQQRDSVYASHFINNVSERLPGKNSIGVSINNLDILTTYNADPRMCIFCNFLKKVGDGYWANQISVPEKIENLKFMERKQAVELSPFYRFIQKQKKEGKYQGYEKAQLDFIDRYKVDFAVVEVGAPIPPQILSCADTVLVDNHSGVRLVLLKRPCSSTRTN